MLRLGSLVIVGGPGLKKYVNQLLADMHNNMRVNYEVMARLGFMKM